MSDISEHAQEMREVLLHVAGYLAIKSRPFVKPDPLTVKISDRIQDILRKTQDD